MDKKSKISIITSIAALAVVIISVTYAYFSARITGLESASTINLIAGTMGIHYSEGNETFSISNIYPREEAWITKTFTLTGNNTTDLTMYYDIGLVISTNTFPNNYLSYDLRLVNSTNGTPQATTTNNLISGTGTIKIASGSFTNANNDTHNYELKIYFKDNGLDQNDSQGSVFNAKITVANEIVPAYNYQYNAPVTNGTSVSTPQSQYEYRYNEEGCYGSLCSVSSSNKNIKATLLVSNLIDGWHPLPGGNSWGVRLIDKTSTAPVNERLITSINNVPITSMAYMFYNSQATSINLMSFNTSNVTNMESMFDSSQATSLNLHGFDTSNVTNMEGMFNNSLATSLDLSSFDTSNVTDMSFMFASSHATSIDVSSFDTSSVTYMNSMFTYIHATTLDLSSFDLTNVIDITEMVYSFSLNTVYARNSTDANRLCAEAGTHTAIYVGTTKVCDGQIENISIK